ncbi:MAG: hypothetical protein ACU837_06255 [Gammaproteobacteria bacterium]
MKSLSELICGDYTNLGELSDVLSLLDSTIDNFSTKCLGFLRDDIGDISTLGAYCGRTLLEAACIALIGRVTPYRLLLLKRYQEQPNYELGVRHKISIEWKGDILPKEIKKDWAKADDKSLTAPLLSEYMGEIFWIPAFEAMLNDMVTQDNPILIELKSIQVESICQSLRKEAEEIYSSLSKGIHQEFIIPHHISYDTVTVQDLLQRTIDLIVKLALISNYIPTAVSSINKIEILNCLDVISREIGA